jgi:hypothetical protein
MLLKDVDKKLDMQCVLVLYKEDRIFNFSRTLEHTLYGFPSINEKDKNLIVFVPKSDAEITKVTAWTRGSTSEIDGLVIASISLEDSIYKLLVSLGRIPSASSALFSIEGGNLTLKFRLHHDYLSQLSAVLIQNENLKRLVKEIKILPSEGFITILKKIGEAFPLYVLEYDLPLTLWENKDVVSVLKNGGIGELANDLSENKKHKMIIYGKGEVQTGLSLIVPESTIYETPLDSAVLETMDNMFDVLAIQRCNVFFKAVNDRLRILVFLKKQDVVRHISEAFNLYSRTGVTVNLLLSRSLSDDAWDTL